MKRADPRVQRAEKLLLKALQLIAEIKAGVPPPRKKRRRAPRKYKLPAILQALRDGAKFEPLAKDRDPRLPSRGLLAKYRKAHPAFGREAGEILRERHREAARRNRGSGPTLGANTWAMRLPGRGYDWDEIATRIENGAVIGPYSKNRQGLPSHTLIMARRKADPVFARRVAAAIGPRMGAGRQITHDFDSEKVLELIRRGAVIKASPPEPGMPLKYVIDRRRQKHPDFNVAVKHAIAEARQRRALRERKERLRASGSSESPDIDWGAVIAEIQAGASINHRGKDRRSLPSARAIAYHREKDPAFASRVADAIKGRLGARGNWREEHHDNILELVRSGAKLTSLPPAPGMPTIDVLRRMRRDSPIFAAALTEALAEARRRRSNLLALKKLGRNGAWELAQHAVPGGIDPQLRGDIVGELSLMLLSGLVGPHEDLAPAWKKCRTRLSAGRWKEVSLDAPISGTDGLRRIDLLAEDAERF